MCAFYHDQTDKRDLSKIKQEEHKLAQSSPPPQINSNCNLGNIDHRLQQPQMFTFQSQYMPQNPGVPLQIFASTPSTANSFSPTSNIQYAKSAQFTQDTRISPTFQQFRNNLLL
jgi:hypothetical protein